MNYEKQSLGADLYQLLYKCFFKLKEVCPLLKKRRYLIVAPFFKFTIEI